MAVYTKVSEEQAAAFLADYDLGALGSLVPIRQGVENSNYFLDSLDDGRQRRFVLTLFERRVYEGDLPFFVGLMEHLAKQGVPCPMPMRNRSGAVLGPLCGRPAALTTFLSGAPLPRITPPACEALGQALAELHLAARDFSMTRTNALGLSGWAGLFKECEKRADEVRGGLTSVLRGEIEYLMGQWPNDLPTGIIHADLFPDNVFFERNELCGIIDFYFACNDALAYDLGIALNAWCFERDVSFNITKARALLRGYELKRPLTASEKSALPCLARGGAFRFLLTRVFDWLHPPSDALVNRKDPLEYLARLQFFQKIDSAASLGLYP